MDMTTIAAAQASIKAVLGLAQGATAAAVDHQLKERLISIQAAILDTQAKLGDAQEERLSLLNQVADLKEKVRGFEQAAPRWRPMNYVRLNRASFFINT